MRTGYRNTSAHASPGAWILLRALRCASPGTLVRAAVPALWGQVVNWPTVPVWWRLGFAVIATAVTVLLARARSGLSWRRSPTGRPGNNLPDGVRELAASRGEAPQGHDAEPRRIERDPHNGVGPGSRPCRCDLEAPLRVLVSEDDAPLRDGLELLLAGEGYDVCATVDNADDPRRWSDRERLPVLNPEVVSRLMIRKAAGDPLEALTRRGTGCSRRRRRACRPRERPPPGARGTGLSADSRSRSG
ncbi:response regulator [Streptomyces sp. NPDC020192]|uniref:response regulator n=1 Tax=Streptomyces sp. NPDC020192 TaxID=3365066 RepID=UPI0037A5002C